MQVYKLRHIPTGLFYQPVKGKLYKDKSNLGIRGKLYETHQYPKNLFKNRISISDTLIKKFKPSHVKNDNFGNYLITKETDWEVVVYNLKEVDETGSNMHVETIGYISINKQDLCVLHEWIDKHKLCTYDSHESEIIVDVNKDAIKDIVDNLISVEEAEILIKKCNVIKFYL